MKTQNINGKTDPKRGINLFKFMAVSLFLCLLMGTVNASMESEINHVSWAFDTHFYYNQVGTDYYEYGALCRLYGNVRFDLSDPSGCSPQGNYFSNLDTYQMDLDFIVLCESPMHLGAYTGETNIVAYPFMTHSSNSSSKYQLLGAERKWDTGAEITCNSDNKTCRYQVENMNYCANPNDWDSATASDKILKLHLSEVDEDNIHDTNLDASIGVASTPLLNKTTWMLPYSPFDNNIAARIDYFQYGETVFLNGSYSDSNGSSTSYNKLLVVNITNYPSTINPAYGEIGLWDCESLAPDNNNFYLSSSPSPLEYQALKSNCCNLLISRTTCSHNALYGSGDGLTGVDQNGNYQKQIVSTCQEPLLVYYYNTLDYQDKILEPVYVDYSQYENTITKNLVWDGTIATQYEACFNFYDFINNTQKITIDGLNLNVDNSGWSPLTNVNLDSLTLVVSEPSNYQIYFMKDDYNDTQTYSGSFSLNPVCTTVHLKEVSMDLSVTTWENKINIFYKTGTGQPSGNRLSGASVYATCKINGETLTGFNNVFVGVTKSTTNLLLSAIPDGATCYYDISKTDCNQLTADVYFEQDRDLNKTTFCTQSQDPDENETIVNFNMQLKAVNEVGVVIPSLNIGISGTETTSLITNIDGLTHFDNIPVSGRYLIKVNDLKYKPYSQYYDGSSPFIIILYPAESTSFINMKIKLNGSLLANATIIVREGEDILYTGFSGYETADYGIYEFDCESLKTYSVTASYAGVTGKLENLICPEGEGKSFTLDISDGVTSPIVDTTDSVVDFSVFMWPFVEILLFIFSALVLKRMINEFGK